MKTFLKLCGAVCRKNRGFTVGLFLMSVLSVAIAFLGANFAASSSETVRTFLAESGMPDVICETKITSCDTEALCLLPGIRQISPRLVLDMHMEAKDGTLSSVRVILSDPSSPFVQTVHEEVPADGAAVYASLTKEYAEYHGVHAGDTVRLLTPFGDVSVLIKALVSNPETMGIEKDRMSAYEDYQFAYLYLTSDMMPGVLGDAPLWAESANQWLVYREDGASDAEWESAMRAVRAAFAADYLSETITADSDALKSIDDDIQTIRVLCTFIPGITFFISLGFGFIFIRIVVENQRKTVGLLRALGFSVRKTVLLFITYTVLINTAAMIGGLPAGYALLRLCLGLIASAEGIVKNVVVIRPFVTAGLLAAVFLIGAVSALLSSRSIAGIDPSEAYGGIEVASAEPPAVLSRMRVSAFLKISLASVLRNYRRQIVGALCITACVISMCVGFEGVQSIGYPIDAVYGGRYRYDLTVRNVGGDVLAEMAQSVRGIDRMEEMTYFTADVFGESVRVSTVAADAEMTVLTDAAGNRLWPGEGVILEEMRAKERGISVGDSVEIGGVPLTVTGIAREILYPVFFVSPETARKLGHGAPNGAMLRLSGDAEMADVKKQIAALSEEAYFTEFALQKENIRSGFLAMRSVMFVLAVLSFGIGSLLIYNITILDFNENRSRYAALRALGTPVRRMGTVSLVQNLSRVLPGALLACPLCYVCVSVLLGLLSNTSQQYVTVRYPVCLLLSCLIPFLYVLLGTAVSLRKIRKMDFCYYLNEVE